MASLQTLMPGIQTGNEAVTATGEEREGIKACKVAAASASLKKKYFALAD